MILKKFLKSESGRELIQYYINNIHKKNYFALVDDIENEIKFKIRKTYELNVI